MDVIEEIRKAALDNSNILDTDVQARYQCRASKKNENLAFAKKGGFCLAFPMIDYVSEKKICYRIWYINNKNAEKVARHVAKKMRNLHLDYFVDYDYLPEAIKVNGQILPGIKMEWVEGETLDNYIINHPSPYEMLRLANKFLEMCKAMCDAGVSHGDLSCSNILITSSGEIKLVDYDSFYVPSLGGKYYQTTCGQSAFQHPLRKDGLLMSSRDDYFSQQVIYLSLLGIAHDPSLIERIDDKELIFNSLELSNVENLKKSKVYEKLSSMEDEVLTSCLKELCSAISSPLSHVRSIVDFIKLEPISTIIEQYADFCGCCGHHFLNQTDLFCPDCGKKREFL